MKRVSLARCHPSRAVEFVCRSKSRRLPDPKHEVVPILHEGSDMGESFRVYIVLPCIVLL